MDANVLKGTYTPGYGWQVEVYGAGEVTVFNVGSGVNYNQVLAGLKNALARLDGSIDPIEAYGIANSILENTPGVSYAGYSVVKVPPSNEETIYVPPYVDNAQKYATTKLEAELGNQLSEQVDMTDVEWSAIDGEIEVYNPSGGYVARLDFHSAGDTVIEPIFQD
ncbi:hypothetical protein [Metallosphaera hakonensis]|uniref:Uncharacterized protein n=1 Tax=Metallosphaera hakonensis JCM 8857 = DSM 7519 TaxID=1293036 RepID=A0A2U9ITH2_9CREN|nr:hypothetical protein [Metallosphaera hakonensis]